MPQGISHKGSIATLKAARYHTTIASGLTVRVQMYTEK
jgi:hypothetical protein